MFQNFIQILFVFVLAFISSPILKAETKPACRLNFDQPVQTAEQKSHPHPGSLAFYLQDAERRQPALPPPGKTPVERWQRREHLHAVSGPQALLEMRPDGIGFVSHQLIDAEAGVVKRSANSGLYTTLRARTVVDGQIVETNIGAPITALQENLHRAPEQKSLVREEAKAVIIYLHGVGTGTTGHHTVINIQNALGHHGIDVIGLDLPWHAEGDLMPYARAQDYFERLRAFVDQYIAPSGKPVFVAGHSGGGQLSDMLIRSYLKNEAWFRGVIPMSYVVDPKPGRPLRRKLAAEVRFANLIAGKLRGKVAPEERNLHYDLLHALKIDPIAGYFYEAMTTTADWSLPSHLGENWVPALYIAGKNDWLQVGREKIIRRYLLKLKNVKSFLYGKRFQFGSKVATMVGHMIFDHRTQPGNKGMPETYGHIVDFISSVLHEPLPRQKTVPLSTIGKIFQEYANVIAFRSFVDHYVFVKRQNSPKLADLNERLKGLRAMESQLAQLRSHKGELKPEQIESLRTELSALYPNDEWNSQLNLKSLEALVKEESTRLRALQTSRYVPPGDQVGIALLKNQEQVQKDLKVFHAEWTHAKAELLSALNEEIDAKKKFSQAVEGAHSTALDLARTRKAQAFTQLDDLVSQTGQLGQAYILKLSEENRLTPENLLNVPPELAQAFENYYNQLELCRQTNAQFAEIASTEAESGLLPPSIGEIWRQVRKTSERVTAARVKVEMLEGKALALEEIQTNLMVQNVENYSEGYFAIERIPVRDLLADGATALANNHDLTKIFGLWEQIWAGREPAQAVTAY